MSVALISEEVPLNVARSSEKQRGDIVHTQQTKPLRLPCPGSLSATCNSAMRSWYCETCRRQLLHGPIYDYIYCGCGFAPATTFTFRCNDTSTHGHDDFKEFPRLLDIVRLYEQRHEYTERLPKAAWGIALLEDVIYVGTRQCIDLYKYRCDIKWPSFHPVKNDENDIVSLYPTEDIETGELAPCKTLRRVYVLDRMRGVIYCSENQAELWWSWYESADERVDGISVTERTSVLLCVAGMMRELTACGQLMRECMLQTESLVSRCVVELKCSDTMLTQLLAGDGQRVCIASDTGRLTEASWSPDPQNETYRNRRPGDNCQQLRAEDKSDIPQNPLPTPLAQKNNSDTSETLIGLPKCVLSGDNLSRSESNKSSSVSKREAILNEINSITRMDHHSHFISETVPLIDSTSYLLAQTVKSPTLPITDEGQTSQVIKDDCASAEMVVELTSAVGEQKCEVLTEAPELACCATAPLCDNIGEGDSDVATTELIDSTGAANLPGELLSSTADDDANEDEINDKTLMERMLREMRDIEFAASLPAQQEAALGMAVGDKYIYVTDQQNKRVVLLWRNRWPLQFAGEIELSSHPQRICYDKASSRLFVLASSLKDGIGWQDSGVSVYNAE